MTLLTLEVKEVIKSLVPKESLSLNRITVTHYISSRNTVECLIGDILQWSQTLFTQSVFRAKKFEVSAQMYNCMVS